MDNWVISGKIITGLPQKQGFQDDSPRLTAYGVVAAVRRVARKAKILASKLLEIRPKEMISGFIGHDIGLRPKVTNVTVKDAEVKCLEATRSGKPAGAHIFPPRKNVTNVIKQHMKSFFVQVGKAVLRYNKYWKTVFQTQT